MVSLNLYYCVWKIVMVFLTVNSAQLEPTEKRVLMRNYLGQVDLWASLLETALTYLDVGRTSLLWAAPFPKQMAQNYILRGELNEREQAI